MSTFQRGVVKRIAVEIEYPDGSTKSTEIENPEQVSAIAFSEATIQDTDLGAYNVSESDWKENPAMMVYSNSSVSQRPLPFCTHNGCK